MCPNSEEDDFGRCVFCLQRMCFDSVFVNGGLRVGISHGGIGLIEKWPCNLSTPSPSTQIYWAGLLHKNHAGDRRTQLDVRPARR